LTSTNKILTWGTIVKSYASRNLYDFVTGTTNPVYTTPIEMPKGIIGSRMIDKIAMGGSHVLVTTTDKLMFSFGGNTYAQLGDGTVSKLYTITLTL
jgi:alpha-tubulin suppressor-like RCC1 family protein